jgi:hypothetical protein
MPARVVREEINASGSLQRVSIGADLTFRALIVACDDYGRIDGRIQALKAALFPMRDEVTLKKLEGWLVELAAGPDAPIIRYVVDGRPFVALTGWEKHRGRGRRGRTSKCPEPLPRKSEEVHATSEEMHVNPPGNREAGDEKREAGIGIDPQADPRKPCVCPDRLSDEEREKARTWAAANRFTPEQLAYAWNRVRDWSHGKREKRADWLAVLRNAMSDGWALKGFVQPGGSGPNSRYRDADQVIAEAKRKQAEDEARARAESPDEIGNLIDLALRKASA